MSHNEDTLTAARYQAEHAGFVFTSVIGMAIGVRHHPEFTDYLWLSFVDLNTGSVGARFAPEDAPEGNTTGEDLTGVIELTRGGLLAVVYAVLDWPYPRPPVSQLPPTNG